MSFAKNFLFLYVVVCNIHIFRKRFRYSKLMNLDTSSCNKDIKTFFPLVVIYVLHIYRQRCEPFNPLQRQSRAYQLDSK